MLASALPASLPLHAHAASKAEIWFAPQAAPPHGPLARAEDFSDYMSSRKDLDQSGPAFEVFQFYAPYLVSVPDAELAAIVSNLREHGKKIAVELGVLHSPTEPTPPQCGGFGLVEAYGTLGEARLIAGKIAKAGGRIDYIAMDEPIWFGHYYVSKPGQAQSCNSKVDELIEQARPVLAYLLAQNPDLQIIDVEPTAIASKPDFRDVYHAWTQRLAAAVGKPISQVHLDVLTMMPAHRAHLATLAEYLRSEVGQLGVIANGKGDDKSDAAWLASARSLYRNLIVEIQPDEIIVQSWDRYPQRIRPDGRGESLGDLLQYVHSQASAR